MELSWCSADRRHCDLDPAGARSIPLTKENRLPGSQGELAAAHRRVACRSDEHGFDVGGGVALRVLQVSILGAQLCELPLLVPPHARPRPFIAGPPRPR